MWSAVSRKKRVGFYTFIMARYGGILSLVMPVFISTTTPQVRALLLDWKQRLS